MMEASVVPQDTGPTTALTGPLEGVSIPPSSSSPPLLLPSLPSNLPSRPCRPKPLPPPAKPTLLPSRPPLPPATPPSLPPPLPPVARPSPPLPNLLPPISPSPASPPPPPPPLVPLQLSASSDLTPALIPCPAPFPPLSPTVSSSPTPPSEPTLPPPVITSGSPDLPSSLGVLDQLVGSSAVWQPQGLSQDQSTSIMEKETAGAFLLHGKEEEGLTLSVRLPQDQGAPLIQSLAVKRHKTFVHLDGSSLVFDDILKLISFYCASRDILAVRLRLPRAITTATKREELEVISALGTDFWTSELHQQAKNQDVLDQNSPCMCYVNPVSVEDNPSKDVNPSPVSNPIITSSLQNGEAPKKEEDKPPTKTTTTNPEIKYKRPPPRPPSLGFGSGMGLLFSSAPTPQHPPSATPAAVKKEEVKGGGGEREERKSMSTSPSPSRPPVPVQGRAAPPLPPAPLRRISSKKRSDREVGEGTERERGQNPASRAEETGGGDGREEEKGSVSGLLGEGVEEENGSQKQEEAKAGTKDEKDEKEVRMDTESKDDKEEDKQKPGPQGPSLAKRPSRPVPPPRRKPCAPDVPGGPNQAAGVVVNQSAGTRVPPPSPARKPDVSLYSPQGGAVLATDPDSCSTSSTEEEGEGNQEPEQNSRQAESRSPKAAIRRTSTTVMLDRARYRMSSIITGLISHENRLTQRIVELARDPLSYFGNLVKEHRAFTLETMSNHNSSTDLLQEIRQMMTQLKSYLLQSTELQAMLEPQHQYAQDKLETIAEAALCKSVLKPIREQVYKCLETVHTRNNDVKQLTQNQSVVLGLTTTALGVTTAVPEASAMEKISLKLNKLHLEYSPQKKIEHLLKACKLIYDSMSISCPGRAHGADDFLPVMMYVLARSNLSALMLDVEYMMELMDPSLTIGEGSYYLTTTYGALEHIKTFDQQRSATRQLSREVQDSIHRWERRRTLNQERTAQGSVRDFLTVCCPEFGANPKTLGVLPTTTVEQLAEQCAARFEEDSYTLSVYMDGVERPLASTELALTVKNSCQPGVYCFVYHPISNQPAKAPGASCPRDPPPAPPTESLVAAVEAPTPAEPEEEEDSLITL